MKKVNIFTALSKLKSKPAILAIVPEFSESYVPLVESKKILKPYYNPDYLNLSYPELLKKCEEFYKSYTVSEDQVKMVEEVTRGQSKSKVWFQQRTGRVTA